MANQNEGTSLLSEGAITLVTGYVGGGDPVTQKIRFNSFDDDYLLSRNVHMPLTKKAMQYWAKAMPGLGWDSAGGLIDQYNPALVLDPEFMGFNHDGTELFVGLQENSALARIDTATGNVLSIDGYGLKPITEGAGADILDDGECKLVTSPCLYLNRNPDGIDTVQYNGVDYILTANEGSDFDLGDYEEKQDSNDIFTANGGFALANFTFSPEIEACRANFAEDCESKGLEWCSNFELTIGSSAVDYSNTSAPRMTRVVGFGGRGMSIFRLSSNAEESMTLVFDSVSTLQL